MSGFDINSIMTIVQNFRNNGASQGAEPANPSEGATDGTEAAEGTEAEAAKDKHPMGDDVLQSVQGGAQDMNQQAASINAQSQEMVQNSVEGTREMGQRIATHASDDSEKETGSAANATERANANAMIS